MIRNSAFYSVVISICIAFAIGIFILGYYDGFDGVLLLLLAFFSITALSAYSRLRKVSRR